MIHYHGLPITPETAAARVITGGHAFVSFRHPDQLPMAIALSQSFAVDNGAFTAWRAGKPITDWRPFYGWVSDISRVPNFDFAVIPDVIDGSEDDNDALLSEWPFSVWLGAPVWHMHESLDRLKRLCLAWPRVCVGSSGEFSTVGNVAWWNRMSDAMGIACDGDGYPIAKLHGLRMLDPDIFGKLPLSSADSTNIGQNIGIDQRWRGTYTPATKEARAQVMRERIESANSRATWRPEIHFSQPSFQGLLP